VRPFAGYPLIATSIAQAFESRRVDRVTVSTDDAAIAEASRSFGADVVDRPAELATDESSTAAVLEHAVRSLPADIELVVTLQPTNPLRPSGIIDRAIELFEEARPDSVVSVSASSSKRGRVVDGWFEPDYTPGTRSQDLAESFRENGLVYVTSRPVAARGDVFGSRIAALPVDEVYALGDIDSLEDFERTERLFACFRDDLAPRKAAIA
jgi:N-acylneuraminate cytidylyltransferase